MPTDMRVALVALLALLLGGCSPPKTRIEACATASAACWRDRRRAASPRSVEDRAAKAAGASTKVSGRSGGARRARPDPRLAGGLASAIALAPSAAPLAKLNDSRHVFIDQRGTGSPTTRLQWRPAGRALLEDSSIQAGEGVRPASMPIAPVHDDIAMADFDGCARASAAKLNLWGGSYGTRAAPVRRYGPRAHGALDGVAPRR